VGFHAFHRSGCCSPQVEISRSAGRDFVLRRQAAKHLVASTPEKGRLEGATLVYEFSVSLGVALRDFNQILA
jgi:hypothetical protein